MKAIRASKIIQLNVCLPNEILKLFTLLNMRSNHLEYTVEKRELDNVSD